MSKKSLDYLYIEVLQNGQPIANYARSVDKHGWITLGAKKGTDLHLPNYALRETRKLAKIEKKGVQVYVEPGCEGFATTSGVVVHLSSTDKTSRIINLRNKDNASVGFEDLIVLYKVGPAPKKSKQRRTIVSSYRGSIPTTALGDRDAIKALVFATVGAAIIFAGVLFGFAKRQDDRPKHFSQLPQEFTLRFIHPLHLKNAPEALQQNLNRGDLIGSVTAYYDATSAALVDAPVANANLLLPTTSTMWSEIHKKQKDQIENLLAEAKTEFEASDKKSNTATVSIPVHVGESLLNQRHRMLSKYETLHKGFEANLAEKRALIHEFAQDEPYDFADYKNAGKAVTSTKAKNDLAKIRVFRQMTDEDAMYHEAETMAEAAAKLQRTKITSIKHTQGSELPTVVTIGKDVASYLPLHDLAALDEKLKELQAGELGHTVIKTHSEPLIGRLDPKLIERVITKNRFQLQLCFELALRRDRRTTGDMEWIWRVDTKGKISDLNLLTTTINDKQMVDCVRKKIAAWQFPRPRDGSVEIRYPFSFSPAKG